jgi:hypothetical protein
MPMGRKSKLTGESNELEEENKTSYSQPKVYKKDPGSPIANAPLKKESMKKKGSKFDLQDNNGQTTLYRPEFKYDQSKKGT